MALNQTRPGLVPDRLGDLYGRAALPLVRPAPRAVVLRALERIGQQVVRGLHRLPGSVGLGRAPVLVGVATGHPLGETVEGSLDLAGGRRPVDPERGVRVLPRHECVCCALVCSAVVFKS